MDDPRVLVVSYGHSDDGSDEVKREAKDGGGEDVDMKNGDDDEKREMARGLTVRVVRL